MDEQAVKAEAVLWNSQEEWEAVQDHCLQCCRAYEALQPGEDVFITRRLCPVGREVWRLRYER